MSPTTQLTSTFTPPRDRMKEVHWSRAMRAWADGQDWLTLERLPTYDPS